jgi:periplasmic protein TonB
MNPFRSNIGTLNEILFKDKNKSYGAYAIRSAYGSTVFKSLGLTSSLIVGTAWVLSLIMAKEIEVKIPITDDPPTVVEFTVNIEPPKDDPATRSDPPGGQPPARADQAIDRYTISNDANDSNKVAVNDPLLTVGTTTTAGTSTATVASTSTLSGTNTVSTGGGTNTEPFNYYEEAPSFPGGLQQFWSANLRYPSEAREAGVQGKMAINFVLDENGKIMSCKVIRKLGFGCDEEVLRVVKLMPDWKPAKINGKPIRVTFNQVVEFKLR